MMSTAGGGVSWQRRWPAMAHRSDNGRKLVCLATITVVLLAVAGLPGTHAGPGPSPINSGSGSARWWPEWEDEEDTSLAADEINITTAVDQTALLPCRVLHLHDKTVSWIRARDLTVLAVDRITVTTDARFSVKHPEETGDWILEIRGAQLLDSGTYDCQVNTYPKKSTRVNLRVLSQEDADVFLEIPASDSIEPQKPEVSPSLQQHHHHHHSHADDRHTSKGQPEQRIITLRIPGRGWAEVMAGKALGLSCVASGNNLQEVHSSSRATNSLLIEWTLDEVPVTLLFNKDKVEVYEDWQTDSVTSQLTLYDLKMEDGGSFACHAPHAITQVIPVTVLYPGFKPSFHEDLNKKYPRRGLHDPRLSFPDQQSRGPHHQMDAASGSPSKPKPLTHDHEAPPPPSRAASCASHRTVLISGAVMLVIMIINCAVCATLYWKTH